MPQSYKIEIYLNDKKIINDLKSLLLEIGFNLRKEELEKVSIFKKIMNAHRDIIYSEFFLVNVDEIYIEVYYEENDRLTNKISYYIHHIGGWADFHLNGRSMPQVNLDIKSHHQLLRYITEACNSNIHIHTISGNTQYLSEIKLPLMSLMRQSKINSILA